MNGRGFYENNQELLALVYVGCPNTKHRRRNSRIANTQLLADMLLSRMGEVFMFIKRLLAFLFAAAVLAAWVFVMAVGAMAIGN
jgi:hypothetical protein